MKAFRFVLFSILIPIICALFFVLDGFCANAPLAGLAPSTLSWDDISTNHNVLAYEPNSYYEYYLMTRSNDSIESYIFHDGYRLYWVSPNYISNGEVQYFYASTRNYRVQGTSLPNSIWSFTDVNGKTMYYTYFDIYANRINLEFLGIPQLSLSEFNYSGSFGPSVPDRAERPLSLHGFTYNLVSNQDYISSVLSSLASVKTDYTEYDFTVGSYTFKWDSVLSDKVTPFESVFVEYGYIKDGSFTSGVSGTSSQLITKNEFTSYTLPVDLFTFMPTTVSDFVNELLLGKHRAITFTPSYYDSSGTLVFGRTLVFDLIGQNTIGGRPQSGGINHGGGFSNDTEVMLPDGSSTSVGFGTSTNKFFQFLWDVWPEGGGDTYIDKSDDDKFYINYITNNNGLTIDDINYILDNDKRFGGGTTQVVISPQFDPNGISNNDDLWLGKLRDLYQMILGFNPLMGRIVTAFSSYFIFLPDWVLNFMFTVGSIGLLLGVVNVIRG